MDHLGAIVRRVQTTEHVFSTETDVVFSTGFEARPLPLVAADGPDRETARRRGRVTRWQSAGSATAEEATLVRAVADGSEDALAALYDRHVDGVHAVALRLTSDRQVAEEVVQETFLALWNRAELFDPSVGVARDVAADDRPQPDRRPAAGRGPPPAAGLARGPRGRG